MLFEIEKKVMSMQSSLSTCLLCREKAECSLSSDLFNSEQPNSDLLQPGPAPLGWADSVSDSVIQLLQLDTSFRDEFGKAGYCGPCHLILLDIHSTLGDLKVLEEKLGEARETLRAFFRNNYAQSQKDAAELELLTSLNLSRTGPFLTDDYDALIRRIYEGLGGLDAEPDAEVERNLPHEPLPTLVIKLPRRTTSSPKSSKLKVSPQSTRPRFLRPKLPISFAEESSESSTSESEPSDSNSSGNEGLNVSEVEESDYQEDEDEEWKLKVKASKGTSRKPVSKKSESKETRSIVPNVINPATGPRLHCNVDKCSFSCKQKNRMRIHVRTQHRETSKSFKCDQCDLRFERETGLTRHVKLHTKKPSIFCSICHKGFYENWYLKRHVQAVHTEKTKVICRICSKGYLNTRELEVHERLHDQAEGISLACVFCDLSFTTSADLKAHVSSQHEVPKCTECHKVFVSDRRLSKHLERVHAQAEPGFKCTLCPHVSRFRSSFAQHMNWHSAVRQFVCDTCGKSYKSVYCLKHHTRTHTGETPYACSQCGKTFTSSTKLRNHAETHNQTKAYVCHQCGKCFRARKNLSQHVARHKKGNLETKAPFPSQKRTRKKGVKPGPGPPKKALEFLGTKLLTPLSSCGGVDSGGSKDERGYPPTLNYSSLVDWSNESQFLTPNSGSVIHNDPSNLTQPLPTTTSYFPLTR